jgi:hypothetical protein
MALRSITRMPPLTVLRQFDTCRLIPSRFAQTEDSVLKGIAQDASHLQDLFDLDNATNQRLVGERGGLPGIGVDELVFGTPNFRIVNAAFTSRAPRAAASTTASVAPGTARLSWRPRWPKWSSTKRWNTRRSTALTTVSTTRRTWPISPMNFMTCAGRKNLQRA